MGAVYEALDLRLKTRVALKQTTEDDPEYLAAFEREAQLLAGLQHSGIPHVSDYFTDGQGQFLVMQYIEGANLDDLCKQERGPLPVMQVLGWADELLDVLTYLHSRTPPIFHRDIKPSNIKRTPEGKLILLDFGLAKGTAAATSLQSKSAKSVFGYTLDFAPLEQIQGQGTDARSDLYSLAATLYWLLAEKELQNVLTRAGTVYQGQPDPLRPLHEVNPHVPRQVSNALMQALAIKRDDRPPDAPTLKAALRRSVAVSAVPHKQARATEPLVPREQEAARQRALLSNMLFPVTLEQWQVTLAHLSTTFGQPNGYFCYVPQGTYAVGGWGKGVPSQPNRPAVQHALPQYWIARHQITNAQFRLFVEGDGYTNKHYWTSNGWSWRTGNKRTKPYWWDDTRYNQPNQPVVGVTWYEVMAYATWLTQQLAGALPEGYAIRLPTEAEWEVAAAYDGQGNRRMYPWGDTPAPDADRAIFKDAQGNKRGAAAPVGERAAGAAACGAHDLAGNVWEWCASSYKGYPQAAATGQKDFTGDHSDAPLRGSSWYYNITYMHCGARFGIPPVSRLDSYGLRVVCAPSLR
ncbi:MAG: SUMF1/EgtB/PvdO family nonheme iron enzyme [Chloroflexaceae bacterium]|nr:SUMF1/EgtB/PvdO family nonheme iron enzyme [Chloroflexaceae bacterium]